MSIKNIVYSCICMMCAPVNQILENNIPDSLGLRCVWGGICLGLLINIIVDEAILLKQSLKQLKEKKVEKNI